MVKCTKFDFGWGSSPGPAGGAYSALPDSLDGFKGPTSKGRGRERRDGQGGESREGRGEKGSEEREGKGKGGWQEKGWKGKGGEENASSLLKIFRHPYVKYA